MNYLHSSLLRQGCQTYKVYQHSGIVYLDCFDNSSQEVVVEVSKAVQEKRNEGDKFALKQDKTAEDIIIDRLEFSLRNLQKDGKKQVTIFQLFSRYSQDHKQPITKDLKSNKLPNNAFTFVTNNCSGRIKVKHHKAAGKTKVFVSLSS